MDLLLPRGGLLPAGLLPVGLRFPDTLVLIFGLKLPRRMARELVLPLMSRVSVGVRRRLSEMTRRQRCLAPVLCVTMLTELQSLAGTNSNFHAFFPIVQEWPEDTHSLKLKKIKENKRYIQF